MSINHITILVFLVNDFFCFRNCSMSKKIFYLIYIFEKLLLNNWTNVMNLIFTIKKCLPRWSEVSSNWLIKCTNFFFFLSKYRNCYNFFWNIILYFFTNKWSRIHEKNNILVVWITILPLLCYWILNNYVSDFSFTFHSYCLPLQNLNYIIYKPTKHKFCRLHTQPWDPSNLYLKQTSVKEKTVEDNQSHQTCN